jgi:hypothetical protein
MGAAQNFTNRFEIHTVVVPGVDRVLGTTVLVSSVGDSDTAIRHCRQQRRKLIVVGTMDCEILH